MDKTAQRGCLTEKIYLEVGPDLLQFFRRRHDSPQLAEDLLQETFAAVLKDPGRLLRADSPRAYLFGVARNLSAETWRRSHPTEELPAEAEAEEMSETLRFARLAFAGEPAVALPVRRRGLPLGLRVLGMAACVLCAGLVGVFAIRGRHESPRFAKVSPVRQIAAMPAADEPGFWSARRLRSNLASPRAKNAAQVLWISPVTRPELFSK